MRGNLPVGHADFNRGYPHGYALLKPRLRVGWDPYVGQFKYSVGFHNCYDSYLMNRKAR